MSRDVSVSVRDVRPRLTPNGVMERRKRLGLGVALPLVDSPLGWPTGTRFGLESGHVLSDSLFTGSWSLGVQRSPRPMKSRCALFPARAASVFSALLSGALLGPVGGHPVLSGTRRISRGKSDLARRNPRRESLTGRNSARVQMEASRPPFQQTPKKVIRSEISTRN
jgi:hypothetical protein